MATLRPIITDPPADENPHVLKRGRKEPKSRTTAFASAAEVVADFPAALARCENGSRPDVLTLCGDAPRERLTRAEINAAAAAGWFVSSYRSAMRSATFKSPRGYRVDVRSAVQWFGDEADVATVRRAWNELKRELKTALGDWAYLWPTPALTGQELLRGVLPRGASYPQLPAPILDAILATQGQGRLELLTAPGAMNGSVGMLDTLRCYDARWAYASCLHGLPVGKPAYDKLLYSRILTAADVGYEASFYKFHARVPHNWQHIGLLPRREVGADGDLHLDFPSQPNAEFWGWASGAEVQLAVNHGWEVRALQRIHWPETGRHDLAREWITPLRKLRAQAEARAAGGDRAAALLARAYRAIVLHTVGSWHRTGRIDEGFTPYALDGSGSESGQIPAGAIPLPGDGGWSWTRAIPQLDEWTHPEWSATVWGRTRAKLARVALQAPAASLVALRTDAIWTTAELTLPDDGKPGAFRLKAALAGPRFAPRHETDLLLLMRDARAAGFEIGEDEDDG